MGSISIKNRGQHVAQRDRDWLQFWSVPLAELFYFKGNAVRYRQILSSCLGCNTVE